MKKIIMINYLFYKEYSKKIYDILYTHPIYFQFILKQNENYRLFNGDIELFNNFKNCHKSFKSKLKGLIDSFRKQINNINLFLKGTQSFYYNVYLENIKKSKFISNTKLDNIKIQFKKDNTYFDFFLDLQNNKFQKFEQENRQDYLKQGFKAPYNKLIVEDLSNEQSNSNANLLLKDFDYILTNFFIKSKEKNYHKLEDKFIFKTFLKASLYRNNFLMAYFKNFDDPICKIKSKNQKEVDIIEQGVAFLILTFFTKNLGQLSDLLNRIFSIDEDIENIYKLLDPTNEYLLLKNNRILIDKKTNRIKKINFNFAVANFNKFLENRLTVNRESEISKYIDYFFNIKSMKDKSIKKKDLWLIFNVSFDFHSKQNLLQNEELDEQIQLHRLDNQLKENIFYHLTNFLIPIYSNFDASKIDNDFILKNDYILEQFKKGLSNEFINNFFKEFKDQVFRSYRHEYNFLWNADQWGMNSEKEKKMWTIFFEDFKKFNNNLIKNQNFTNKSIYNSHQQIIEKVKFLNPSYNFENFINDKELDYIFRYNFVIIYCYQKLIQFAKELNWSNEFNKNNLYKQSFLNQIITLQSDFIKHSKTLIDDIWNRYVVTIDNKNCFLKNLKGYYIINHSNLKEFLNKLDDSKKSIEIKTFIQNPNKESLDKLIKFFYKNNCIRKQFDFKNEELKDFIKKIKNNQKYFNIYIQRDRKREVEINKV